MKYKQIKSLDELKELAAFDEDESDYPEFFILLAGNLRSSKRIVYFSDGKFSVYNEIDGTLQFPLTENKLKSETLIIEAIEKGKFYQYL